MTLLTVQIFAFLSFTLLIFVGFKSAAKVFVEVSKAFSTSTESNLQKLFLFADAKRLQIGYLSCLLLIPAILILLDIHFLIVAAFVVTMLIGPGRVFVALKRRRRSIINTSLPTALSQIAGAMEAGSTFISALEMQATEHTGPLGQEFSLLLREQRMGAHLEEALENLAERVQSEDMDLVVSAAMIASDVGGNLSDVFRKLSESLRQKSEMEGKLNALTAQGRLQGNVVSALPFLIALPLLVFEPDATIPLFTSLLGWIFLSVILLMIIVGSFMVKKIVSIDI